MQRPNLIIIGDFLKDMDDEHSLCLAAKLHRDGVLNLLGVVGNLQPAALRACGAKGTLQQLGLPEIPVGIGAEVLDAQTHSYEWAVPYLAEATELEPQGVAMMQSQLARCPDQSVILVLQSALTDALALFLADQQLFRAKVLAVAIMGGVETSEEEIKRDEAGRLIPNNAHNHLFDWEATVRFYAAMQEAGIPLIVTTRDAAYACQLPFSMYDAMEATGNPIGACLKGRQKPALQQLWEAACAPAGTETRGTLPLDRNRQWFVEVFCSGIDPAIPDGEDIWPHVGCFNLYDPLTLLAAIPAVRQRFFDPAVIEQHLVIGVSKKRHGIRDVEGLRQFIISCEVEALKSATLR